MLFPTEFLLGMQFREAQEKRRCGQSSSDPVGPARALQMQWLLGPSPGCEVSGQRDPGQERVTQPQTQPRDPHPKPSQRGCRLDLSRVCPELSPASALPGLGSPSCSVGTKALLPREAPNRPAPRPERTWLQGRSRSLTLNGPHPIT